jgi:hypothetical protein
MAHIGRLYAKQFLLVFLFRKPFEPVLGCGLFGLKLIAASVSTTIAAAIQRFCPATLGDLTGRIALITGTILATGAFVI